MKRVLIFSCLLFIILLVSGVYATNVVYIVKSDRNVEEGYINVFKERGFNTEIVESRDIGDIDFSEFDLILIGNGKLKNIDEIPIEDVPTIIANRYYTKKLGLLKSGRIASIFSNSMAKIRKDSKIIQVYERSYFSFGGTGVFSFMGKGIPSAYLPANKISDGWISVAVTHTGMKRELGDVIAYSENSDKCFFGIIETKFWTQEAKELFNDCVNHVIGDGGGIGGVHDVKIDTDYTNSVNGIRIRDDESGEYLTDNLSELICLKRYKIDYKTLNVGDSNEDVLFTNSIGNVLEWTSSKEGLESGKFTTAGSKTFTVDFDEGLYNINIFANITGDENPEDNSATRSIKVKCGENASDDEPADEEYHDVKIDTDYTNSVNGIRIRDDESGEYLLDETAKLECNKKYVISYKTLNVGNFTEDIQFNGSLADFSWTATKTGLEPGKSTTTGSKTITINFNVDFYNIVIMASINSDDNPNDNSVLREVEVVCE